MARRRKSTGNAKAKENKTKEKTSKGSLPSESEQDVKEDNTQIVEDSSNKEEENVGKEEVNNDNEDNRLKTGMMPLDIQQMILGDLQSGNQGEGIVVSRATAGDNSEGDAEHAEEETQVVVETVRVEDYDMHTEDEEEEQVIYLNDDEGEEGQQYVIVVNSDDFEVTEGEEGQEEVTIHNIEGITEGSCEIITVVRESDYESSQESGDEVDEECDNINAVIGNIGGMHCVKVSHYPSDDEGSNADAADKEDITVTEHERVVSCIAKGDNIQEVTVQHFPVEPSEKYTEESKSEEVEQSQIENLDPSKPALDEGKVEEQNINMLPNLKNQPEKKEEPTAMEVVCEENDSNEESTELECKPSTDEVPIKHDKVKESKTPKKVNKRGRPKLKQNHLPDSTEQSDVNKTENNSKQSRAKDSVSNLKVSNLSKNTLQEDRVTSNTNSSENCNQSSDLIRAVKMDCDESSENQSPVQDCSTEHKDPVKEETSKTEDDKQNVPRSRSGSTDTTGSESGSTSSCGRRRSGRIKSITSLKQESESGKCVAPSVPLVSSTTTPPVPGYEADKPVKVKSRWRRSSELEMGSGNRRLQEMEVISANARVSEVAAMSNASQPRPGQPTTPPDTPPEDQVEVDEILRSFQQITFNDYLTDRLKSKEAKRMVCDCTLTKEEVARGDMGCGEDCLNRLLMIECGARCTLGEQCANKRFQNVENSKCEVFKTEKKGFGLRALEDISPDTFLLEYVGEVLDPKEFRRRAKEYAKDKNRHFYFMALKSDSIIDATHKGNISRFINHSCDPNAETQKWTVNGELRIGFFSKCTIAAGEEITFDYKFQRYGKEAQRCHCESTVCRGWIGEDPEKENKNTDSSSRNREKKDKKKKEDKKIVKDVLDDMDLEEEIEKLVLKNRAQTLLLCRLMVRAEDARSRSALLGILQRGETACLRLFLDYHGLRLIWSWMMDPATSSELKLEILETLSKLPIPNKTMLQDSKVLSVVEKWSTSAQPVTDSKHRSSTEEDSDKGEAEKEKQKVKEIEKNSDDSNSSKAPELDDQQESTKIKIVEIANTLLKDWAGLKEVFRIPKKERIEQMKEHEREADKHYRDNSLEKRDRDYDRSYNRNDYDRRDRDRDRDRDRKRGRDSPDSDRSRKSSRNDDKQSQLTKMERRQLFAIKVAQEEEERLRRQHENQWQEQVTRAAQELAVQEMAKQEMAAQEAGFNGYGGFGPPHQWMPFPPPDGGMMGPQHMYHSNPPPFMFNQSPHIPQHPPFLDPSQNPAPPFPMFNQPPPLPQQPYESPLPNNVMLQPPLPNHPPPQINQLPPQVVVNAPFQNGLPHSQFSQPPPLPSSVPPTANPSPVFQSPAATPQFQPPLPATPQPQPTVVPTSTVASTPVYLPIKLPPKWKSSKDAAGRTYYYHVKTRVSQWEPPIFQAQTLAQQTTTTVQESESETDSSDSEEDSSSDDEDREDDKVAEEEGDDMVIEEELGVEELPDSPYEPETMELLEDIEEDTKRKRSGLVQERIISPRTADEIPDKIDKRKIRELKEKLKRQKVKERLKQKLKKSKQKRSGTSKCEADTSSDPGRKIKDAFRVDMASVIVHYLNYYRKPDAKFGKITSNEDFKHLARKLTHFVMLKELKHCRNVDDLQCNDNVKHKARDFIKKYMAKFGPVYQRPADDD